MIFKSAILSLSLLLFLATPVARSAAKPACAYEIGFPLPESSEPVGFRPLPSEELSELRMNARRIRYAISLQDFLIFVGRDPLWNAEALKAIAPKVEMVNAAATDLWLDEKTPAALAAYREYLDSIGISPTRILERPGFTWLVDSVASGGTLETFQDILVEWARLEGKDVAALEAKFKVVGFVNEKFGRLRPQKPVDLFLRDIVCTLSGLGTAFPPSQWTRGLDACVADSKKPLPWTNPVVVARLREIREHSAQYRIIMDDLK